jgi:hypothetical protein
VEAERKREREIQDSKKRTRNPRLTVLLAGSDDHPRHPHVDAECVCLFFLLNRRRGSEREVGQEEETQKEENNDGSSKAPERERDAKVEKMLVDSTSFASNSNVIAM